MSHSPNAFLDTLEHELKAEDPKPDRVPKWLPKCNSMRTRPGLVEPEVFFGIVYVVQNGQNGVHVATYREQTVQIALESKGAFENGNIGTLVRRVPPNRGVDAVTSRRSKLKMPKEPRSPRVVELLSTAVEWRRQLDAGEVRNKAEIARQEGITRARVTQVMGMLRLPLEIREKILSMPNSAGSPRVTERMLRPIGAITDHREQLREFQMFLI